MADNRSVFQLVWGVALVLAGGGVFYRIPQVMPEIAEIEYFSGATWLIRFSFYLIGVMLIGGGARKIYENIKGDPPRDRQ